LRRTRTRRRRLPRVVDSERVTLWFCATFIFLTKSHVFSLLNASRRLMVPSAAEPGDASAMWFPANDTVAGELARGKCATRVRGRSSSPRAEKKTGFESCNVKVAPEPPRQDPHHRLLFALVSRKRKVQLVQRPVASGQRTGVGSSRTSGLDRRNREILPRIHAISRDHCLSQRATPRATGRYVGTTWLTAGLSTLG
jgi:hypothetical protein